ncbi:type II toxin-antitoxin system RelE/ParE family toxin [Aeromonas hydrophila]|uniref:type II toxin-antitoxin system RelE/ParE family toxin n=1 Tax=Aeromonas hydrophila TaxID=644 RepID=UPI002B4A0BFC|nr:type II toxin-antitoxin system RelE/ParE family toxin [Aeromonas hydrophila]
MNARKKLFTFIETPLFTASWNKFASADELFKVMDELLGNPDAGDVIAGSGGLRKLRCGANSKGKKGGARVIYFSKAADGKIYLLLSYPKSSLDDLTTDQKKALSSLVSKL